MKITKAEYDALPDALKALYKADGDGYESTFMTAEEVKGLKDNNAELLLEKQKAKKLADDAAAEAKRIADEAAIKGGDIEALRKSYDDRIAEMTTSHAAEVTALKKDRHDLTVGAAAKDLSAKLFGKNAGIAGHIVASRLTLEEKDGAHVVRVLGADGKPSAATVEDLEKEIRGNKDYASVLVNPPSGGVDPNNPSPGNGGNTTNVTGSNPMLERARQLAAD